MGELKQKAGQARPPPLETKSLRASGVVDNGAPSTSGQVFEACHNLSSGWSTRTFLG